MRTNPSDCRSRDPDVARLVRVRFLQVGFTALLQAVILFAASGRLDWLAAWAYVGVYVGAVAVNASILLRRSPELIAERAQVWAGAKGWDKVLSALASLFGPVLTLLVAGLDERFGWSPEPGLPIRLASLVCVALGYLLFGWAMASNPFFSGVVRIQEERGHSVATTGPYRYVRHPGYVALAVYSVATAPLLGSLWALFPAGLMVGIVVVRTALEDRTLRAELDGYRDYAERVRYRLIPGLW